MRKICLFIAMSLDGYIADEHGNVDWLEGHGNEEVIDSYGEFIRDVDTVLMGYKTYHQIVTELSPDEWIYDSLHSYVLTHQDLSSKDNITFINQSVIDLVKQLKQEEGKNIWICGGASIIQPLIQEDLIDEYRITVIPTLLGNGIRLFDTSDEIKLKLIKTQSYNGMIDLVYRRR